MATVEVSRTLVKSPPELWADLEGGRLAEALEAAVTPTEPERALAWEADGARGVAVLEPSGWGTKVTFRAEVETPAPPTVEHVAVPRAAEPQPEPEPEPEPPPSSLWARLLGRRTPEPVVEARPVAPEPPAPQPPAAQPPAPAAGPEADLEERFTALLDSLGSAHRKPFVHG